MMTMDLEASMNAVERTIAYNFRNRNLLEQAITHSSFPTAAPYERLEFLGDAVLGLAITNHLFLAYPSLLPSHLTLLRSANVCTEKLARVAIRRRLHLCLRHNSDPLQHQVEEFENAIAEEDDDPVAHGGLVKAPKVLADIVESVAAAVYIDVGYDLQKLWVIIRGLLKPIVTPEDLTQQPVTALYELCQKNGKQVDIKPSRNGAKSTASVYVDGQFVTSASSEQKDIAKLDAAKATLCILTNSNSLPAINGILDSGGGIDDDSFEIESAKQTLHALCGKKKWSKPLYRIEKDEGPSHDKKFVSSVQVVTTDGTFQMSGDVKARMKDAENSAAFLLIRALQVGLEVSRASS